MIASGYERQSVDFHPYLPGHSTFNVDPVAFGFEEQPNATIPLMGLFVNGRLLMRGGLMRLLVLPGGIDLSGPQVRLESGALKLFFRN